MSINAVIYARSSSDCPLSADEQVASLRTIAADHSWTVTKVFIDRPTTAKKGRERRPGQIALIDAIRSGTVDKTLLYSIDRLGRSPIDLIACMEACRAHGVGLYVHEQNLDTATSNGLSLFDLAGMMAYHLRQSRRDRILCGQAAARASAVRFGRPPISIAKVEKAKRELAAGKGVRQVARLAGISAASVSRLKSGQLTSRSCK